MHKFRRIQLSSRGKKLCFPFNFNLSFICLFVEFTIVEIISSIKKQFQASTGVVAELAADFTKGRQVIILFDAILVVVVV